MLQLANEYTCCHESLLQDHSLKIKELETKSQYKEARIDDLYNKIENMDKKIDQLNSNVNKLVLQSNKADNDLEQRLIAMETKIAENDKAVQDNRNRFTIILSVVVVFFTALTFIFNFILK